MTSARLRIALAPLIAGAMLFAGCGETTANEVLPPGAIAATIASPLTGVAGQTLPSPIEFRVVGTDNQALAGVPVTFTAAAGGGSVEPAEAVSDGNGLVRTRWTLGRTIGLNGLVARASASVTATVLAAAVAGRAANVGAIEGDDQTAAAGAPVPIPPGIRVRDANGNPVRGVLVQFAVLSGGGRVTEATRLTGGDGEAIVGSWILGTTAGVNTLSARVEESGVTNNPIVFSATATAGTAARTSAISVTTQTTLVATPVFALPSVRVTDINGNAVANQPVTFAISAGGGQLTGGAQVTNVDGVATVGSWTLGTLAGQNQLVASVAGAPDAVFNALGVAGAAAQLSVAAGDNQQAQSGTAVAISPAVLVEDAYGNPVSGLLVTFAIASGGGTVVNSRQSTDASGIAELGAWFLGPTPGINTLLAFAAGLPPLTFAATGIAGNPISMVANSTTAQSASAGGLVAAPPSVIIRDLSGNPVPGITVSFDVTAGGGSITGTPAITDASGVATLAQWRLGAALGTNAVVATAPGLPSVTFLATATAGTPTNVVLAGGDNQVALQGTAVSTRPSVRVTDANGNPVIGAVVVFAVTGGGGSVTGGVQNADGSGVATVGAWTLGSGAPNTLTATVQGSAVTGNPVAFTAQSATAIAITAAPTDPVARGTDFTVSVQLRDASGAAVPLSGVSLSIGIATGGGTLGGVVGATTNASGAATFIVNVTGAAGPRTLVIARAGLTSAITATITFN